MNDLSEIKRLPSPFGSYGVTRTGVVWSFKGRTPRALSTVSRHYPSVGLYESCAGGWRRRRFDVHRLVMLAFVGLCPDDHEVAHNNGKPTDCRLKNLRYATRSENTDDRARHGTVPRGEDHPNARLTDDEVHTLRARYEAGGVTQQELADVFGVAKSTISRIIAHKQRSGTGAT